MDTDTGRSTEHPFQMYEAIRAQPEAFGRVATQTEAAVQECAERLANCARLFLVGIGTSHHAAQVGEHLMRTYAGGMPVQAVHAFDFALYGPPLAPEDAVVGVSHRGTKQFSVASLARARDAGCATVLITGEGDADVARADAVLRTVPQEQSSAHTVSYTGAVAALASLADHLGRRRTGRRPLGPAVLRDDIPAALRAALETEHEMAALARAHLGRRRIWVTGGGPGAITAQEIALKIKETSYLPAEGMPVETMLHGPFQCVEAEDLFILIAPAGAAQPRVIELAGAVRAVGAPFLAVSDGTPGPLREGAAGWCVVPPVPEPLSALVCAVPLQLLAYHLALARGTNPDGFRLEDPRFARVRAMVKL